MICHGCNGLVGRDCFNPHECEEISRDMEYHARAEPIEQELQMLHELLKEVANSDMAQREEDDGNKSPLLERIRNYLARATA